ncbi:MAG: SDR family oxidoreductase [Pseudomonadota bacterium]|nr:SDR family oxidoreductase [Pseudomonadota bacterium]
MANCLLKRMVEPDEIAESMLFLACNPAITGQTLAVDCGRTC